MTNALALPSISKATLPVSYLAAVKALAKCVSIDECKTWRDKMEAMASYAKQSNDKTLEKAAVKIRARAIKRCGQLLKEVQKSKGGRPGKETSPGGGTSSKSRKDVATEAGLSRRQRHQALQVANVSEEDFEAAVEREDPASIKELVRMGTTPKPLVDLEGRDPKEFAASTQMLGEIRDLAEMMTEVSPEVAVRGAYERELGPMVERLNAIVVWAKAAIHCVKTRS